MAICTPAAPISKHENGHFRPTSQLNRPIEQQFSSTNIFPAYNWPSTPYFCAMLIEVLKSKIHRLTVTEANLNYIGSITLDPILMEAANMIEGEKVQVLNCMNGERLETYIITGERGSGVVCLNGPAARKVEPGDVVIVITYAQMTPEEAKNFRPSIVFPDTATNKLIG
jgi:aspartate 1-decarboxylase